MKMTMVQVVDLIGGLRRQVRRSATSSKSRFRWSQQGSSHQVAANRGTSGVSMPVS